MKKIWKIICCIICLGSCFIAPLSAKDDKSSTLHLETKESGTRSVVVQLYKDDVKKDSRRFKGGIDAIDQVVKATCPNVMTYVKEEDKDYYFYTFTITFTSLEDYKQKVATLLPQNEKIEIKYKFPESPFVEGVSLEESFDNGDLLEWLNKALKEQDICENANYNYTIKSLKVSYDGKNYDSYSHVDVKELKYHEISSVKINTQFHDDQNFSSTRIIEIFMPEKTYTENKKEITAYLEDSIPENGKGEWSQKEESSYFYSSKKRCFTISFEASNIEELLEKTKIAFHTKNGKATLSEGIGDNRFKTYSNFDEELDVSAFGSNSNNSVDVEYTITSPDFNTIKKQDSYYSGDRENQSVTVDAYSNVANFSFQIARAYTIVEASVSTKVIDDEHVQKQWLYYYQADEAKDGAEKLQQYFDEISGFKTEMKEENGQIVLVVSAEGTVKELNYLLDQAFGRDNAIYYQMMSKETTKYQMQFQESMNYDNFNQLISYSGNYRFELTGQKNEKITPLQNNQQNISEDHGTYSTDFISSFSFGYQGEILIVAGVLLIAISIIILVILSIGGYLLLAKRWIKREELQELSWKQQQLQFIKYCKLQIQNAANNAFSVLSGIFIPVTVHKEMYLYFNGNKAWILLAIICIVTDIIVNGTHMKIQALHILAPIVCIFCICFYFYSKLAKYPKLEQQYDTLLKKNLEQYKIIALTRLGLVEEQIMDIEPIVFWGPAVDIAEKRPDYRKDKILIRWLKKLVQSQQYHEYLSTKKGSDGVLRYNMIEYSYVFFTQDQILYYTFAQNVYKQVVLIEESHEYFYRDIIVADSGYQTTLVKNGFFYEKQHVSFLKITGRSGLEKRLFVKNSTQELEQKSIAMKQLIKEKKSVITQEELENENYQR